MKKMISVLLTVAFLAVMVIIPASAEMDERLEALQGRYIELFPEFAKEEFHDYWLAAAIPADYAESSMMQDCIKLFVDENMEELAGEEESVIEITDAEGLAAINENLSGNYMLVADIDLSGIEWTPIGTWVPSGESEEEQEIPSMEFAFTGTFNGNGHTVSNLKIDQPDSLALGLFGCISGAEVRNFKLENASVDGSLMSADVVGYSFMSTVDSVDLVNGKVTAHMGEMSSEGMFGGIVGAGMGSLISNCTAEAEITIPDGMANAGIIGGGLEMTNVSSCYATGTVTAGNDCYGLGGISGCGFAAEYFRENTAENVMITAGSNSFWIGGITGYAGGFEDESFGMPVTVFEKCSVKNVVIAADSAEGVGEIVGSAFFNAAAAEANGAPFDQPTVFELIDCIAE